MLTGDDCSSYGNCERGWSGSKEQSVGVGGGIDLCYYIQR
ncbi:hypothetical protein LCGC14_1204920 [marine sediment metagenome]|uniref:Uncharacterized protein n=1 Tax=marine sediment metagenome TaxID=412755 RepID=A0A0F9LFT8_9ZZZZ